MADAGYFYHKAAEVTADEFIYISEIENAVTTYLALLEKLGETL
jgi:hypothetical protein